MADDDAQPPTRPDPQPNRGNDGERDDDDFLTTLTKAVEDMNRSSKDLEEATASLLAVTASYEAAVDRVVAAMERMQDAKRADDAPRVGACLDDAEERIKESKLAHDVVVARQCEWKRVFEDNQEMIGLCWCLCESWHEECRSCVVSFLVACVMIVALLCCATDAGLGVTLTVDWL